MITFSLLIMGDPLSIIAMDGLLILGPLSLGCHTISIDRGFVLFFDTPLEERDEADGEIVDELDEDGVWEGEE